MGMCNSHADQELVSLLFFMAAPLNLLDHLQSFVFPQLQNLFLQGTQSCNTRLVPR